MPFLNSAAAIASFVFVFGFLFTVTNLIDTKLKAAGYDLPKIILVGFPKDSSRPTYPPMDASFLDTLRDNQYAQLIVGALAAISTLVLYLRFASGESMHVCDVSNIKLRRSREAKNSCIGARCMEGVPFEAEDHHFSECRVVRVAPNKSGDLVN